MPFGHRHIRAHFGLASGRHIAASIDCNILGDINQHRAGTAGTGEVESLVNGICQIAYIAYEKVVLNTWARNPHGIALLESILAYRTGTYLTTDHHHGDREIGRASCRERVGKWDETGSV